MMRDTIANPSKTLSEFRKELQSAGFANAETLVPRRGNPMTFPLVKVGWCNRESLVDICGYLLLSKGV